MLDVSLLSPEKPTRITRALYDRIVSLGLLADARVELLHGAIIDMSPNDPPHASPVAVLTNLLVIALAGRAMVRVQLPILAADESEPEPDLAIVPSGDYSREHPTHALLVIEVAASSLRKDRLVKGPLYASSGFSEYWIFDVEARVAEVHRGPVGDSWTSITRHTADETIAPEAFPDVLVRIGDVVR